MQYCRGLSHQSFQGVFGTIHLLRTICTRQPAYIDTTCLSSFTKAVQRIVREYITTSSVGENKGFKFSIISFNLTKRLLNFEFYFDGKRCREF